MRSSVRGHRATRHAKRDTLALRWKRVLRPNYALKLTNAPAFLSSSGCPRRVGSLTLIRWASYLVDCMKYILQSIVLVVLMGSPSLARQKSIPRFESYRVSENFVGKPARLKLTSPGAKCFGQG